LHVFLFLYVFLFCMCSCFVCVPVLYVFLFYLRYLYLSIYTRLQCDFQFRWCSSGLTTGAWEYENFEKGGGSREKGEEVTKFMPHAPVGLTATRLCH